MKYIKVVDVRDFIPNGDHIQIKNTETKVVMTRLYFADYPTDEECIEVAGKVAKIIDDELMKG